ncbi:MAG: hypothetical protein ACK516_07285, partial [Cyanobium sp.]
MGQKRIALLGPPDDPQVLAVARELERRSAAVLVVPSDALEAHRPVELHHGRLVIDGQRLDELEAL